MKLKILGMVTLLISSLAGIAQDQTTFSDEELAKYATVMVWAEQQMKQMSEDVSTWVKENETLAASKYNELSKASKKGTIGDVVVTEDEMAVFTEIQERTENAKTAFTDTYKEKIKSDIGAGLYNDLRKALKSDDELSARYDAILDELRNEASGDEEQSEAGEG